MYRFVIFILVMLGYSVSFSQENLISNPSFEEYITCDYDVTNMLIQDVVPGWTFKKNFSPRYLSTICIEEGDFATPKFGNAYVASHISAHDSDTSGWAAREYLQAKLLQPIEPAKDYYISYYMNLPWEGDGALSHFGVHFTNEWWEGPRASYLSRYSILLDPQLEIDTILNLQRGSWTKVEHCFQVDSIFEVMVVGVFAEREELMGIENSLHGDAFHGYDNFFLSEIEPDIRLGAHRDTICAGECVTLSTNHSLIPGDFTWQLPGSDILSSKDSTVTVCYDREGSYDIGIDIEHCTGLYEAFYTGAITVVPALDHEGIEDQIICVGDTIDVDLSTIYNIMWSEGSVDSERIITQEGTYSYSISNGVCSDTFMFDITYAIQPSVQLAQVMSCIGDSIEFLGTVYIVPGLYQDTLYSQAGCDSIYYEIEYTYFDEIELQISSDYGLCPGEETEIEILTILEDILWYDGDMSQTKTFDQGGVYTFTYRDEYMCVYSDTVIIEDYKSPIVMAQDLIDVWYEEGLELIVTYSDDVSEYMWEDIGGLDCDNCAYPKLINPVAGTYRISVTNAMGCTAVDDVIVSFKNTNIYIPNTINSKATDIDNEYFYIQSDIDITYEMYIYDRWGNLLHSNTTARSNNREDGWLPLENIDSGVYTYMIKYIELEEDKIIGGTITVIR